MNADDCQALVNLSLADPAALAFLYGRMPPSVMSQLEAAAAHQRRLAGASSSSTGMMRSPSPVMTEEDAFRLCMAKIDAGTGCPNNPQCELRNQDHYHCRSDACVVAFKCV